MAGDPVVAKSGPKVLTQTDSTRKEMQDGRPAPVELVKLVKYDVNVRSFHPNKKFEPLGFRFHGDNRGFSLEESFHAIYPARRAGRVTSRVWQVFSVDFAQGSLAAFKQRLTDSVFTASNTSSGPTVFSDGPEPYVDPLYRPEGKATANAFSQEHAGEQVADMNFVYDGKNFAFRGSRFSLREAGRTVVPSLDVHGHVNIKIERVRKWMDIVVLIEGDGFPNCEAFIEDPAGNKLFLGTHVRIGTPATHLFGDNHRIMFANVMRVELTTEGNFGSRMWLFAQVLGGTPDRREDYPAERDIKTGAGSPTVRMSDASQYPMGDMPPPIILPGMDQVAWAADPITKIGDGVSGGFEVPMHISAYEDVGQVWQRLRDSVKRPPVTRHLTVSAWNDYHLHRDPNEGRSKDGEDLDPSLWKRK
ncbi:TPA: hypothetical protein QDC55_003573 [Burkholderia cenocepacia]|nr:hypothetical protein [Burkholderia cenocepacia]HDR9813034.1 hypothetical protein [Burkholderia cenocepacia]HDR9820238.1 hypothetical protein [Burkholderia cenocepacia]HDR9830002.1 hypothetical protein [Burkholderia cenocepacia]